MAKAKKKGNYIVLVERVQTREMYFLESVSYSKRNFKLLPIKDIDKAKTYASADTVQAEIDFVTNIPINKYPIIITTNIIATVKINLFT